MISEELPSIIFTSLLIIVFIAMLFFVVQDYVVKSANIYLYRTATTLVNNGAYGKNIIDLEDYESKEYLGIVSGYKFSNAMPEEYDELLVVSLPALVNNATNYSEVRVYAYK